MSSEPDVLPLFLVRDCALQTTKNVRLRTGESIVKLYNFAKIFKAVLYRFKYPTIRKQAALSIWFLFMKDQLLTTYYYPILKISSV